jgi:hypothetical protein
LGWSPGLGSTGVPAGEGSRAPPAHNGVRARKVDASWPRGPPAAKFQLVGWSINRCEFIYVCSYKWTVTSSYGSRPADTARVGAPRPGPPTPMSPQIASGKWFPASPASGVQLVAEEAVPVKEPGGLPGGRVGPQVGPRHVL